MVFVLPLMNLVESLHLLPKVIGEKEEWILVVLSLCGFLNDVDVSKTLWRAEPRDKSCLLCALIYMLAHPCSCLFLTRSITVCVRSTCW
jgi:hypothetical protein